MIDLPLSSNLHISSLPGNPEVYCVVFSLLCICVRIIRDCLSITTTLSSLKKQRFDGPVMSYKISSLIAFSVAQGLLEKPEISNKSSTDLSSFAGHPRLYCLLISLSRDSVAFAQLTP